MKAWLTLVAGLLAHSQLGCERPPTGAAPSVESDQTSSPTVAQPTAAPSSLSAARSRKRPLLTDRGIYPEFNAQVEVQCPSWIKGPFVRVTFPDDDRKWLTADGTIVCAASDSGPHALSPLIEAQSLASQDRDRDGIVDSIDLVRGAKKAAINGAAYSASYDALAFPMGDVSRTKGVCTDVVVRSMRNAGADLQELLATDIAGDPKKYPMVTQADPYIDHRRVRTLLPYFEKTFRSLPVDPNDTAAPFLPGDILFMNTLGDERPEHLGIVADELGASELPLVINNWTVGTVTKPMDLLGSVPVTHRFRTTADILATPAHQGLAGVLHRQKITLPKSTRQALLVVVPQWNSSGGTLTRWDIQPDGSQKRIGNPVPVRIGHAGLGRGKGLHGRRFQAPNLKKEGDKKAPAGVFSLGTAFGRPAEAPYRPSGEGARHWPYRGTNSRDFFIDDPKSDQYNTWVRLGADEEIRVSAERLAMYALGLIVEHNTALKVPGAGSAIFLHTWKSATTATVGCTAMDEKQFLSILGWLDPTKKPVLVQTAGHLF